MSIKRIIAYILLPLFSNAAIATTMPSTSVWKGMYLGGFAGEALATSITSTEPLRLDNNAYWYRPFHNSFNTNTRSSVLGGITIGYNWLIGKTPYVVGLEGEYGYINLHGSSVDPNQSLYAAQPGDNLINTSQNIVRIGNSYTLLSGRIGYAFNHAFVYVKSGVVLTTIVNKYNSTKTEDMAPAYLNIYGSNTITRYGVGGGIEYALPFLSNLSAKIEYMYLDIDKTQYVYGHCSCHFLWRTTENFNGIHTLKIGLNYHFN